MRPALVLALLALLAALALRGTRPPAPRPRDAPATDFSAMRARDFLAKMVGDDAPHPPGTAAHERVRELVSDELTGLGYEVVRPSQLLCGRRSCAEVTDLLVRIPGHVSGNAVVLTAHYDSVPAGPGASDDGMGVATIVEVARALAAAPKLRRPVWLLVTDGEEAGLLGAKALVRNPMLTGQIGVVVNVEARGTSGPSLMFETSAHDAGLVRTFAKTTKDPIASSLFPTIYSMLPNDTDLSVYKAKGLAGLNYAIVGGAERYHTPRDDLAHADLGSLQHHGDNVLSMVRALADGAGSTIADDDLVFFDCLGLFVVRWPARAALPLALALLAALVFSGLAASRRKMLTPAQPAYGLLGALAWPAAALAGALGSVLFRLLGAAPAAWVAHPAPMIFASCALGAMAAIPVVAFAARRAGGAGMWWGTGAALALGAIVVSARLPGLSFLFVAPAALAAVGTFGFAFGTDSSAARREAWAALMPAGALLVWVPSLGLVYDGLGTQFLAALAAGTGLLVWTAAPLVASFSPRARSLALGGLGATVVAALVVAGVAPRFDADLPAHVSIRSYALDGEPWRTLLFAPDGAPDALARSFPGHAKAWPWSRSEAIGSAEAGPDVPQPAPTLEVVSTTTRPPFTQIAVRLRSSRGARVVGLAVMPGDDVRGVRIEGEKLEAPEPALHREGPWSSYESLTTPPEGVVFELTTGAGQPVEVYVYDRAPGLLGGAPARLAAARGPAAVPYGDGDYSVVARRVAISPRD